MRVGLRRSTSPSSAIRTSPPQAGVPTEPGLRSRPAWLVVAVPPHSVIPYPSSTVAPKRSSNASSVSTASGAPPTWAIRIRGALPVSADAASSAVHIEGTPMNTVTPSCSIVSSAAAGSKRETSARHAPAAIAPFMQPLIPKTCASGAEPKRTSSSCRPRPSRAR